MDNTLISGTLTVVFAGLLMGATAWPVKLMKHFKYEHWAFCSMITGLIIIPWAVTVIFCPNAINIYSKIDLNVLIKANLFSLSWGMSNILAFICLTRIGFSLTNAVFTGIGASLGVTVPMLFKGSGLFENAPDITSAAGMTVVAGVSVMIIGVIFALKAGFLRTKELTEKKRQKANFITDLIMLLTGSILSCGISFAFVYSQGPIKEAMKDLRINAIPSTFAVWAIGLLGGALVNIMFPAFLLTHNKSWAVFKQTPKEVLLAAIIGINFCLSIALMGKGMILLGPLGASIGFGIQQTMQMFGGQAVGFISGEWSSVSKKTRMIIFIALAFLILAAIIMSYGNII